MLNLIPLSEKKKILTEYRLRLATVSVFAITALVFSSLILLIPSYLLAISKYNEAQNSLDELQKTTGQSGQEKDVNIQVLAVNKNVDLFLKGGSSKSLVPSLVIANILNGKGKDIKIIGFTYDVTAAQERIVITGMAANRDSLSQFIDTLKSDPSFTSVDLPISSYVKSINIDFSAVIIRIAKK